MWELVLKEFKSEMINFSDGEHSNPFSVKYYFPTSFICRFAGKGFIGQTKPERMFAMKLRYFCCLLTVGCWWMIAGSGSWRYWEEEEEEERITTGPGRDVIAVQSPTLLSTIRWPSPVRHCPGQTIMTISISTKHQKIIENLRIWWNSSPVSSTTGAIFPLNNLSWSDLT